MTGPGERFFTWLIRLYPRDFRRQYADDLLAFFRQDRAHPKYGTGRLRLVRFWIATVRDLLRAVWAQRRPAGQGVARARAPRQRMGGYGRDLRDAWRGLWTSPGVTIAALAVLTLGIGAGTAIYSVVDAVVLRGLPFDEDHRLVRVSETDLASGRPSTVAPQNYLDWLSRQQVFESIGAIAGGGSLITTDEPVENLRMMRVTASLFDVLRVRPARGRALVSTDETPGAPPVALISDDVWRRRFHADPSVVGRTIASRSSEFRILGVMPPGFTYPVSVTAVRSSVDLWVPFIWTDAWTARGKGRTYAFSVVARLKPGVTLEDASAQMASIRDALAVQHPTWFADRGIRVYRLQDAIVGASVRSWMFLLLAAVTGVVLMACLNAAHLLVARAVSRGPELAVRAALGASRWALARSLLVQSLLLSLLGAAGGVLVALWGVELLRATLPGNVPRLATVAVDLRVLAVAMTAAVASGAIFGTIPAMQASRPDVVTLLGQAGRSLAGGRTTRRVRGGLVIAEVALAVVLLSGAGLFLASYRRVTTVDLGFDPAHVAAFLGAIMNTSQLTPPRTPEASAAAVSGQSLVADAVARLRAVPGVIAVAPMQGGRPLSGNWATVTVQHFDRQTDPFTGPDEPVVRSVGPGYLDVLHARMVHGRWIADTDHAGSEPVVVLNDEAARRYFGSRDPIGARILMDEYARTVVGVIGGMRWRGPESDVNPEAFIPFAQTSHPRAELLVRTDRDPTPLVPALQAAIRAALPGTTVNPPTMLESSYGNLIAQRKFNMIVLAIFGAVAVAIAAIGIYALVAYVVAQRRREFGVRVALGAGPSGILSMVVGGAVRLMIGGLVPGLVAAFLLERWARAFLFNAPPRDPALYAGVALVLLTAGVVAAIGPARRATRVDPLVALREE